MSAFSNGTEFECFVDANCFNCVADDFLGAGPEGAQCPYLDDVILNPDAAVPKAWVETPGMDRYRCTDRRTT